MQLPWHNNWQQQLERQRGRVSGSLCPSRKLADGDGAAGSWLSSTHSFISFILISVMHTGAPTHNRELPIRAVGSVLRWNTFGQRERTAAPATLPIPNHFTATQKEESKRGHRGTSYECRKSFMVPWHNKHKHSQTNTRWLVCDNSGHVSFIKSPPGAATATGNKSGWASIYTGDAASCSSADGEDAAFPHEHKYDKLPDMGEERMLRQPARVSISSGSIFFSKTYLRSRPKSLSSQAKLKTLSISHHKYKQQLDAIGSQRIQKLTSTELLGLVKMDEGNRKNSNDDW